MKKILTTISFVAFATTSFGQDSIPVNNYEPVNGVNVPDSTVVKVFTSIDQMPEFPGGQAALMQYLASNIEYPAKARKNDIQGKVMVKFVVCENGALCNEEVVRSIGGGCEEEVIRVIKAMPKWKAGKMNGKPVRVYYTLPVTFRFNEEDKSKKAEK